MKKTVLIIFSIFSIIISGAGISYYFYFSGPGKVVILLPEPGETKKKPKDPGGLVIPNSDSLAYEGLKEKKKSKINLLPDPESPVEIIKKHIVEPRFLDSIDKILDNIEFYEEQYVDSEQSDIETLDYVIPNVLLAQKNDNNVSNNIDVPGTNLNIIKAVEAERKIANYQNNNQENIYYKIQLSSAFSYTDAQKKWQNIAKKHRKILNGAHLIIRKIEAKNERIFFLVMAGNYGSLSRAKLVCKKLLQNKQNCIVTK